MTRTVLCGVLAGGTLVLGLLTALVQAENRERGARLNEQMEAARMLEGVTRDTAAAVLGLDWGPLPVPAPNVHTPAAPRAHKRKVAKL
ncbi:MAG: hypothetical protein IPJ19_11400 [Planctomycetes bacterium]|nr:hypothetical protein [Planctomycetota bacterium]